MIGGFEKHLPPSNGKKIHSTCCQTQGERKEQSEKCCKELLGRKNLCGVAGQGIFDCAIDFRV
jgi:hypothetical protein